MWMVEVEVQKLDHYRTSRTTANLSSISHAQACERRIDIGGAGEGSVTNRNVDNDGQFKQGLRSGGSMWWSVRAGFTLGAQACEWRIDCDGFRHFGETRKQSGGNMMGI